MALQPALAGRPEPTGAGRKPLGWVLIPAATSTCSPAPFSTLALERERTLPLLSRLYIWKGLKLGSWERVRDDKWEGYVKAGIMQQIRDQKSWGFWAS